MNEVIIKRPEVQELLIKNLIEITPGEIARIEGGSYHNHIVRRTFSTEKWVVENLSDACEDSCWTSRDMVGDSIKIVGLPNAKLIVEL